MADGVSVLVFDMSRTGEPDGERVVPGFASVEAARAYAEARVRSSIEELRADGQRPQQLRSLWHLYGEDCSIAGDGWKGREQLDLYIAVPAAPAECNWSQLTPRRRRFHAIVLVADATGEHSAYAGGFLRRFTRPTRDDLFEHFRADAVAAFARQGKPDIVPASASVVHIHALRDPPSPPSGRPLKNWRVDVDFVCHDIKFGSSASGVFAWPEKPAGEALDHMTRLLMSDACALRGDSPDNGDFCDVLRLGVEETADAPHYDA
ncbi:MAG: hypothetical protein AB7S80_00410 [Rhizobiaceae bacterium]